MGIIISLISISNLNLIKAARRTSSTSTYLQMILSSDVYASVIIEILSLLYLFFLFISTNKQTTKRIQWRNDAMLENSKHDEIELTKEKRFRHNFSLFHKFSESLCC